MDSQETSALFSGDGDTGAVAAFSKICWKFAHNNFEENSKSTKKSCQFFVFVLSSLTFQPIGRGGPGQGRGGRPP